MILVIMNVLLISLFGFSESGRSAKIAFHTFKEDKVSVITSDFNHRKKSYYDGTEKFSSVIPQFLHVLPYKRNLSVKRLISHLSFARALKKYLNSLSDHLFHAVPKNTTLKQLIIWFTAMSQSGATIIICLLI